MNAPLRSAILCLLCMTSNLARSQNNYDKLWGLVSYTGQYQNYLYMIEPQLRLVNQQDGYEQFLLNAGGGIPIATNLQFWIGQTYANFSPYNSVTEDVAANDLNEYRLWQQFLWTIPRVSIALKSRLEERYSFENAPWAVRFRERGYWTKAINHEYSLFISDEVFINLKAVSWIPTQTIDQNRAYVGILKKMTPSLSLSISYMNQHIFRSPPENNQGIVLNFFINMEQASNPIESDA